MSKVFNDYMQSEYAQNVLKGLENAKKNGLKKKAQAMWSDGKEHEDLYDVGWHEDTVSESAETMGVANKGGGGGVYETKPEAVPTSGNGAVVEGLKEVAEAMEEVALKAPTGKPFGEPGNQSLKWAKERIRQFTKTAEEECSEEEKKEEAKQPEYDSEADPYGVYAKQLSTEKKMATLKELVKMANDLDSQGLPEHADHIDELLKEQVSEVFAAAALRKKK